MKRKKKGIMNVLGSEIRVLKRNGFDYISLTDMMKSKEDDFMILNWLRNRNTVEFLGIWESANNDSFNPVEFDRIRISAGLNNFRMSAKDWIDKTNAIGMISSPGRYGGTFAHVDIAFEFGMWISAEFKVYLIKEFHRLKKEESKRMNSQWQISRELSKINYRIHTDAIKEHLMPRELTKRQMSFVYASEADLLNMALYGLTAKEWRDQNPALEGNVRDHSTLEQLIVLSNLESLNAVLIDQKISAELRLEQLNRVAIVQMKSLLNGKTIIQLPLNNSSVEEPAAVYGRAS